MKASPCSDGGPLSKGASWPDSWNAHAHWCLASGYAQGTRSGARERGQAQGNAVRREARPGERQEDSVSEFGDLEKKAEA